MPFLLDTNCWIQIARAREHAPVVRQLLAEAPPAQIALTNFSLHSIGLTMERHRTLDAFAAFIDEMGIGRAVSLTQLAPADLARVVEVCAAHNLDFDDAYQYVAAERNGLRLVSLDADFDRTPNGRLTPAAALQLFRDEQTRQQGQQNP